MKKIGLLFSVLAVSSTSFAGNKVIYGADDRSDVYQVNNPLHKKLTLSTAGMIGKGALHPGKDANHLDIKFATTLSRGMNICDEEKFSNQKTAPSCSGFLIAPDLLVTAGHCLRGDDTPTKVCQKYVWVFGFEQKSANHDPSKNIKLSDVYQCQEVLTQKLDDTLDYALIRLKRKVTDRPILKFRQSGKIADSAPLVVIGHPMGLPTKVAAGAMVTKNNEETRFSANLDTQQGNSGSAVMNATTGLVEGILVMGKPAYYPKDHMDGASCYMLNRCDQQTKNCIVRNDNPLYEKGQVVIRMTSLFYEIQRALDK